MQRGRGEKKGEEKKNTPQKCVLRDGRDDRLGHAHGGIFFFKSSGVLFVREYIRWTIYATYISNACSGGGTASTTCLRDIRRDQGRWSKAHLSEGGCTQ